MRIEPALAAKSKASERYGFVRHPRETSGDLIRGQQHVVGAERALDLMVGAECIGSGVAGHY